MSDLLTFARRALSIEAQGLSTLLAALDGPLGKSFEGAVQKIQSASGRVIISGMGKSGHIGRKIASTLASTGTPASFVHPAEASHGDLGMITTQDVVVLLSNSGESAELKDILNYCARFSVPLVAITANSESTIAKAADTVLQVPKVLEACPNGLAPTTSTLLQLAIGDAIAMALLEAKGFSAADFRNYHPGGKLGARIKHASDIMHKHPNLPLVSDDVHMQQAIDEIGAKRFGCVGILNTEKQLIGMITDGDLRRNMARNPKNTPVTLIMSKAPTTISGTILAAEVIELINARQITAVFVVDENKRPEGIIHIHDLLRAGVS